MQHNGALWLLPRRILRNTPKVTIWILQAHHVTDFLVFRWVCFIPACNCPGLTYLAEIVEIYSSQ
jgi:hypothetical protein